MRIMDWSSDVCSSDLDFFDLTGEGIVHRQGARQTGRDFEQFLDHLDCLERAHSTHRGAENADQGAAWCNLRVRPVGIKAAEAWVFARLVRFEGRQYSAGQLDCRAEIGRASCRERGGRYV